MKFLRYFSMAMVLVAVANITTGCSITPKWSQIEKGSKIKLDTFKPEQLEKITQENDPRYQEHRYDYRSTIDGLPAADATFWLKINRDKTYYARAEFNIISPWAAIFNGAGREQTKGRVVNSRFVTSEVRGLYKIRDKRYELNVVYPRGGGVPITTLDPPRNQTDITPIDKNLLAQSTDLVSALLTIMAQYQRGGQALACNQGILTWDGFRLARIRLYPDKTDPAICTADFERLGGFLRKFEQEAKAKPAILSFRVDKRFPLPLEISADTFFIKPALVLTEVDNIPLSYYYLPENLQKTPFDAQ